uniref:amino acid transporter AVT1C-like n=1 Tax=Erigeron canadensis TaxID=72917 RepID=UPI001CB8F212|nr:amino acid transporter AVT1C-like [Erigeron canadensis]
MARDDFLLGNPPHVQPLPFQILPSQAMDDNKRPRSNFTVILNGIHMFCAVTILSVPYAMKVGGWSGIATLALFCLASVYSGYLLGLCFEYHRTEIKTYPDVANAAFGRLGSYFVSFIVFCYNYASCVEYVVVSMNTLAYVFPTQLFSVLHHIITVGTLIAYVMIIVLYFVVCYHNFQKFNFYLTGLGVFLTLVLVLSLFTHGIVNHATYQLKSTKFFNPSTFPMALGFYAYCFAGHTYLPELYQSMREKRQFQKIMLIIFVASFFLYLAVAINGYALFGKDVQSIFVLNMPKNQVPAVVAILSTLLDQVIRYVLGVHSISRDLDELVKRRNHGLSDRTIGYVIRAVLVGTTIIFSLMIPVYGTLMAFIGSTLGIVVALIIPCVCFLRLRWDHVTRPQGVLAGFIIVLALVASVLGISKSLPELIKGVED